MKAVILAGGKSHRMGRDKALLDMDGARLIDLVYAPLKPQANEVIISGPSDYGLGLKTIPDVDNSPKGPVGALYSIWKELSGECEGFFTVPVDGPSLPSNLCERLYGETSSIASDGVRTHQAFAWWRIDDLSDAFAKLNLSQSLSLKLITKTCKARQVVWPDRNLFHNINTSDDWDLFLKGQNELE